MTTFRQLEALVAVVDCASFAAAARALSTSQSAVSRLIGELEAQHPEALFERTRRAARLTPAGQQALRLARQILTARAALVERFARPERVASFVRVGVTELTAMTWLPRLVAALRNRYPRLRLELVSEASARLHERLRAGRLDVAFLLAAVATPGMERARLGGARTGWYASARLPLPKRMAAGALQRYTLLVQGGDAGGGAVLSAWFERHGIRPRSVIESDGIAALCGIAASGLGIAHLPRAAAGELVAAGCLREVRLAVAAPRLDYVGVVRSEAITPFHRAVVRLAQQACDFDTPFARAAAAAQGA